MNALDKINLEIERIGLDQSTPLTNSYKLGLEFGKNAIEQETAFQPSKAQKGWIREAVNYIVLEDSSDKNVLNEIFRIRDNNDQSELIDYVLSENASVWEKLEYELTCAEFLSEIGFEKPLTEEQTELIESAKTVRNNKILSDAFALKFGALDSDEALNQTIALIKGDCIKPMAKKLLIKLAKQIK